MTHVQATLRYLRMAPRKVRLVVNTVRGLPVDAAERGLLFSKRHAARPVLKLLRSAIANAEHNYKLKRESLFIEAITANDGPTLRRYRPRAFGSAAMIRKRSSHVTIMLGEREKAAAKRSAASAEHSKTTARPVRKPHVKRGARTAVVKPAGAASESTKQQ